MYPCCFYSAKSCTATKVDNSDRSTDGSITGKTGEKAKVTCNTGYEGTGEVICQDTGEFTTLECKGISGKYFRIYHCTQIHVVSVQQSHVLQSRLTIPINLLTVVSLVKLVKKLKLCAMQDMKVQVK